MEDIHNYMSSPIISIDRESTAQEAVQLMNAHNIGAILIKSLDTYVGIVTDTDMARKVIGGGLNPETTPVAKIMTSPLKTMDCYMPMEEANEVMRKSGIRHLVITEEEKIVGMLSVKDLVAYYSRDFRMAE
ncbi:MAG: signal transduction protein [Nitrospinae bacterium CG11_big_fil_rev_8_21_14_0_20_56_8]|nr:MAG: signal transduction protein [Nitrospinae bacterium CG11_big_fil_rev_8_21_14_0_20_56_8]